MSTRDDVSDDDPGLARELDLMMQFLHLAPVGLLRVDRAGTIILMNPTGAQLLALLGLGREPPGRLPNLFDLTDRVAPDIRTLVSLFSDDSGVVLDKYRVLLDKADPGGLPPGAPMALGITALKLPADPDSLMVVVTDESSTVRLQRLQSQWLR